MSLQVRDRLALRIARRPRASPTSSTAPCCGYEQADGVSSSPTSAMKTSAARSTPAARSRRPRCGVSARAPPGDAPALIAEVALEATLPADEVEKERRPSPRSDQGARRRAVLADLRHHAAATSTAPHPYALAEASAGGKPSSGSPRDDLSAHYRAIYRPSAWCSRSSGEVPRDRVVRAAERLFGRMVRATAAAGRGARRAGGERATVASSRFRPSRPRSSWATSRPASRTRSIRQSGCSAPPSAAGWPAACSSSPRPPRARLLDRRGHAVPCRGPRAFVAYLGTAPASAAAAEAGVLSELERARATPATADELARARRTSAASSRWIAARTRATHGIMAFFEVVGAGWDFPSASAAPSRR